MVLYDVLREIILPLKLIDYSLPKKGLIIDLGCGRGVITKHLAKNRQREVVGIDSDKSRLPKSGQKNLKFVLADIRQFKITNIEGIILSDVLHHLDIADQKKVLMTAATNLKQRRSFVIKEVDTKEYLRSKLSRLWDFLLYPSDKISYWNSDELTEFLENLGFRVKMIRASRLFPGSSTLFICKK